MDREAYPLVTHQADRLHLPPGYELNYGADVLLLLRDDGSVVAAFSARGATPAEVVRTAEEDYRAVTVAPEDFQIWQHLSPRP